MYYLLYSTHPSPFFSIVHRSLRFHLPIPFHPLNSVTSAVLHAPHFPACCALFCLLFSISVLSVPHSPIITTPTTHTPLLVPNHPSMLPPSFLFPSHSILLFFSFFFSFSLLYIYLLLLFPLLLIPSQSQSLPLLLDPSFPFQLREEVVEGSQLLLRKIKRRAAKTRRKTRTRKERRRVQIRRKSR